MLSRPYRPVKDHNMDSRRDMRHHSAKYIRLMPRQDDSSWLFTALFEEIILPTQTAIGARRRLRSLTWRIPS